MSEAACGNTGPARCARVALSIPLKNMLSSALCAVRPNGRSKTELPMPAVDFDRTLERARLGFHRASIFMGFGVNAVADPAQKNFDLSQETKIRLVPPTDDPKILASYKSEFRSWIVSNGLRELLEGFVDFLEALHRDCLTLAWSKGRYTSDECDSLHSKFHKAGLPEKLRTLNECFGIGSARGNHILSINAARNCYTHRRGKVGPADVKDGDVLTVTWDGLDIFIHRPGQAPVNVRDVPGGGLPTPEGGSIEAKMAARMLEFKLGSYIEFSPTNLAEFCFFVNEAATEFAADAVEYAKKIGIEVRNRESES